MKIELRLLLLICGSIFAIRVIYLVTKKKLNERISLIWLVASFIVFFLSLFPGVLTSIASTFKIDYPPALLFLVAILILFLINLNNSIHISVLEDRIKQLTQEMALNSYEEYKTKGSSDKKV